MISTSTPFITYGDINVEETDLLEDAWGFNIEFHDVISQLGEIDSSPADRMAGQLISLINKMNQK
jgi:hypothetical protein